MIRGTTLAGEPADLLHVDPAVVFAHAVLNRVEPLARQVGRGAVGEMPAGRERQAENRISGLAEREIDRGVGLGAGMRLHVGEAATEQRLGPFDGEGFGDVDEFAPAVVAPAGIAFGILVGQHGARRLQHRA